MISIRTDKITAIKTLRDFCRDTFGIPGSLTAQKEFVEGLMPDQDVYIVKLETRRLARQVLDRLEPKEINEILLSRLLKVVEIQGMATDRRKRGV